MELGTWCGPCAGVVGLAGHVPGVLRCLEKGPSRRSCV